jgi:hypothetical protein
MSPGTLAQEAMRRDLSCAFSLPSVVLQGYIQVKTQSVIMEATTQIDGG